MALTADIREADGTRVEQVMEAIRRRIAARTLQAGARLPSIRKGAQSFAVSPSTVVEAYERLAAEGLIRSRPGSGFYVSAPQAPLVLADLAPRLDRAVDPFWVSRQSLEAGADVLKPGCGWLPPDWMPQEDLRRAMRSLSRATPSGFTDYGTPLGVGPLRQLLARRMAENGVEIGPDGILLTDSGSQALDLICRFFLEPGDAVLVDDPCYFNFLALLRAHRVKAVGVPYTATGPDLERFAEALADHRPRLYITNSGIHNPTGATLSPVTAHRLLKLAEQARLTIVEDDIFGDFEHEPAPRLAAFDGFERVIQISSFSKTLSAAARIGYIAARPDWIEGLIDLKIASSFAGSALPQHLAYSVLKDGSYRRHLHGLRTRLARAMGETIRRVGAIGLTPWIEPRGGMLLWCRLPDGLDAAAIARRAIKDNVVLAPGNVFSVSQTSGDFMRFNVAQSVDPRVFHVLERALDRSPKAGG
ncbi:PLP-dependent aminotransferase family protein [Rhizobium halophytocola]|uniref:DNA-binding transcriptional MocR family regulator n=1 Tax=Rhizobium halophytocola TaxID=735519 RepID=A0ABS4E3L5_9HYPH|nr:PLP-dependent aminotransferase family protein [Rhizobium halophytocola]MBP1852540.1 DNA-binding transcriptional MocR family regulator [Rhizobium halophytocola]